MNGVLLLLYLCLEPYYIFPVKAIFFTLHCRKVWICFGWLGNPLSNLSLSTSYWLLTSATLWLYHSFFFHGISSILIRLSTCICVFPRCLCLLLSLPVMIQVLLPCHKAPVIQEKMLQRHCCSGCWTLSVLPGWAVFPCAQPTGPDLHRSQLNLDNVNLRGFVEIQ